ncbi:MAG: hypothetical protein HRT71_10790 [Flavobacteriales bacterium]|nr:hypothetical protein [Flavobacteriales bacterium]
MISDEEVAVRKLHGDRIRKTLREIGDVWRSNKEELPNARGYELAALHRSLKDTLSKMEEALK